MPIRAYIDQFSRDLFVYVTESINGRDIRIQRINGDVATWVEIGEGEKYEPTFRIKYYDLPDLVQQINGLSIKSDNHFKIEGELDATKYHLEDLRSLLKLKK